MWAGSVAYLGAMQMRRIDPAWRRYRHTVVAEVYESVNQVPVAQVEGVAVPAALGIGIPLVPSRHVVAHKQPRPIACASELHA